jgi:hypothetical protein
MEESVRWVRVPSATRGFYLRVFDLIIQQPTNQEFIIRGEQRKYRIWQLVLESS